jgi:dolichol-phosphate mannosyltransferase
MVDPAAVLVGLATYNELDNLPGLVARIHSELPGVSVLVVDDNSPDGTGEWCQEFASREPWFTCINRPGKLGLGSALALLMRTAVERESQQLVTLDADWSHPPEQMRIMLAAAENADVVVGSRYTPGGKIVGWPLQRRIMSRVMNFLSRMILDLPIGDYSGNYRVYNARLLAQLPWEEINSSGYAFIEEVLWHLKKLGATFAEVPITFTNRTKGKSKISWRESVGAVRMLSTLAAKRWRSTAGQASSGTQEKTQS